MIHSFSLNGYNIVVDVYSGAVHVLDEIAFEAVEYLEKLSEEATIQELSKKYTLKDIIETIKEINYLIEEGSLFFKNPYIEHERLIKKENIVKSLCLNIAHDCNLQCEYCFASKGDFGGCRMLMPFEVAQKSIDFLLHNSGNRKNLEVDFFGGEPLMNFEVVKKTVKYGREQEKKYNKNIRFTITTNATLLDEDKIKFINENMYNVVLSIDGRKQINDRVRYRADKKGTYDKIMPLIVETAEGRKQKDYFARGTYTRYNLDFGEDVLHLADLGLEHISIEPVVVDEAKEFALKKEDLNTIFKEYERLALEYIKRHKQGKGFNFYHFEFDLDNGPCIIKRIKGCGVGEEYLSITPEGYIYPCHQFVENEQFCMGNVFDGKIDEQIRQYFRSSSIFTKEKCKNCWIKFYCCGGCAASAWQFNKDIKIPYEYSCEIQKKRIECALMIKAALCK